jgi:DNA-binding PadR family transcriptional regulator
MVLGHALLGLLIEQAGFDEELTRRLGRRMPGLQPTPAAAVQALRRLRADGLARASARRVTSGPVPRTVDWYESTVAGARALDLWMRASPAALMSVDELIVKLELAQPKHLDDLHAALRGQQRLCLDRLGAVLDASRIASSSRRGRKQRPLEQLTGHAESIDLHARMTILQNALDAIEPLLASSRAGSRARPRG